MSLTSSLRYQEANLTELMVELHFRKQTEEKALLLGLEDIGEEARQEASVKGSQVCVLITHFPFEVPSRGVLDWGQWGRGECDFCTYLSRGLHIKVNFCVVRHREGLNLTLSIVVVSSSPM